MSLDADLRPTQHLSLTEKRAGPTGPVAEFIETLPQLLATRATFHLEVPAPGLPAVMR